MPRTLPAHEIEIGKRLRRWRKAVRLTRAQIAREIGVWAETLANYEDGRAALPFAVFLKLWQAYRVNPQFLADDIGPEELLESAFAAFPRVTMDADPRARFSDVYRDKLAPAFNSAEGRTESARAWTEQHLESMMLGLVSDRLVSSKQKSQMQRGVELIEAAIGAGGFTRRKDALAMSLHTITSSASQMKSSRVETLIERIRALTETRGAKSALARELGVPRQQLNSWLAGVAPSAENALRLLEWVTSAEVKTKDAGRGATRPARKTQASKSDEGKTSSGPPHK